MPPVEPAAPDLQAQGDTVETAPAEPLKNADPPRLPPVPRTSRKRGLPKPAAARPAPTKRRTKASAEPVEPADGTAHGELRPSAEPLKNADPPALPPAPEASGERVPPAAPEALAPAPAAPDVVPKALAAAPEASVGAEKPEEAPAGPERATELELAEPLKNSDAPLLPAASGDSVVPAAPPDAAGAAAPLKPGPAPALGETRAAAPETPLSIVMITPEAHPFASTGGLAEVAAALPQALSALGHTVTLVLPRYRGIDTAGNVEVRLAFRLAGQDLVLSVFEQTGADGVRLAFVDAPELFDRDGLYGVGTEDYPDNAWRYAVFSRAALEYLRARQERPAVIHAHDWQTGLVPVYQKMLFSPDPVIGGVPVVFTIHNLAFQGNFPASTLGSIGLDSTVMDVNALEYWGQLSYLKGGINFSEQITTVSPTYATEILQPELGFGFDGILRRRADDLVGILNGIDTERWNPAADEFVPSPFNAEDLAGKAVAKRALLAAAGIEGNPRAEVRPLIGLISRLTDQKGFDLIAAAADELMSLDASWVLMGSGELRYEELWRGLAARHPGRVAAIIGFDERLAHLIEAGSDLFLMPSRFEPCGLNQLYSHRYGTLPIVRATGGLKDTVEDAAPGGEGTGFTFGQYTPGALVSAVRRALAAFKSRASWQAMQRRAMKRDHSWDPSAREYVKVYRALTAAFAPPRRDAS